MVTYDGRLLRDGKEVTPFVHKDGRLTVSLLADDGCRDFVQIARLVGAAFCPEFRPELLAYYIDGNRHNCHAENLRWVPKSFYTVPPRGAARRTAKLTDEKVLAIREAAAKKDGTHGEIAARFGISRCHASQIIAGTAWKHLQPASPALAPDYGAERRETPPNAGKRHPSGKKRALLGKPGDHLADSGTLWDTPAAIALTDAMAKDAANRQGGVTGRGKSLTQPTQ